MTAQPAFHVPTEADKNLVETKVKMFEADADAMLKTLIPNDGEAVKCKQKPKVDKQCMAADTG